MEFANNLKILTIVIAYGVTSYFIMEKQENLHEYSLLNYLNIS